jgi:predicted dehydrogenase
MKSVAVIGQGSWGKKILNSVQNSFSDAQVEMLSSRIFLSSPSKRNYDVIWIAGRPVDQVKILEIAQSNSKLIILEKPLGSTLGDFSRLNQILKITDTSVDLSRPWCFSTTWLNAKDLIKSCKLNGASVTFNRSGPASHSYITSIEDWLPHDIYLASDLFPEYETQASVEYFEKSHSKTRISLVLQQDINLRFNFLESDVRQSKIEIIGHSKVFRIDLLNQTLVIDGQEISLKSPDEYDEVSRNIIAATKSNNAKTIKYVGTQQWMKSLMDDSVMYS